MIGSACLFIGVAAVTFSFTAFLQTSLHLLLGHRPAGGSMFRNHVKFHHTIYSKKSLMTSPRYLDEERSNTAFYLLPLVLALAIAHPLLPLDLFAVFAGTMILTYAAHVYVHVQFHLTTTWLQRFHWFLRLQRLHTVHHVDMKKNHAVLMPFWDRVLGTHQSAARRQQGLVKPTPRGPASSWLTGNLPDLQGDKLAFAVKCDRDSDGIVQLRLWNQPFYMVSDAALIGEVLVNQHQNFTKPMPLKALSVAFGRGLITSEHDLWRHERRIVQPAFRKARLDHQLSTARECVTRMLDGWTDGGARDVYPEIATVCLEMFTRTIFGETLREEEREAVIDCFASLQDCNRAFSCLPKERLPFPSTLRLRRACKRLDAVVRDLVTRKHGSDGDDFVSLLVRAAANGDPVVTYDQIRDEMVSMWLAGFDTVATGVSWALYLLSEHPTAAVKLEHELDDVLQGRSIEVDDIPRLEWLGKIVKEAHRLYPPAYQIGRVAIETCEIGGHTILANSHVLMYTWAVHRSPRYYDDPDAFRPERWTEEMTRALPKFAYFPFGGGPRMCIGASLATVETALLVGAIAQAWRLSLVPGTRIVPDPALSLPIAGNSLPMVTHRREMRRRRSSAVRMRPVASGCPFSKSA